MYKRENLNKNQMESSNIDNENFLTLKEEFPKEIQKIKKNKGKMSEFSTINSSNSNLSEKSKRNSFRTPFKINNSFNS